MFSTRILGVLLLVAAVVSFGFAIYWFNQSVEPRAKLKEMKASAQTFADITQTEKNGIGSGLSAFADGLNTIGALVAEAAILACDKRAWQFISLGLFLGFSGILLLQKKRQTELPPNPI